MGVLVAVATGVLGIAGRVVLALLLAAFFTLYASLGLLLTPLVALALALIALPHRVRVMVRLAGRLHWPSVATLRVVLGRRPTTGS